jgi:hypothetical protein
MSDAKTDRPGTPSSRTRSTEIPIESLGAIKTADLPDGFILFSEAIRRLEMSMWSGLQRPIAVQDVSAELMKQGTHKARIGFGPWRQRAGEDLTLAACEVKLEVYVAVESHENPVCTRIPVKALRQLILVRGSLPDRAIRPSLKACDRDRNLLLLLQRGCLVVKESEFSRWLKAERTKGRWPSQEKRQKPRIGRPTTQRSTLRNAIIALVRDGVWSTEQPVTELRRRLIDSGRTNVSSADTLARWIDRLHDETGDPDLRRTRRAPRRRSALPRNGT